MAGLVAAFIFAVQMLNFPVLPGVSAATCSAARSPRSWSARGSARCASSIVLIVQALVFADGGVTALGLNITNMALLGTAVGYLLIARPAAGAAADAGRARRSPPSSPRWSAWWSRRRASSLQYGSAARPT